MNNYRIIAVYTTTGQLYDIAEFRDLADADAWAISIVQSQQDIHVFCVDIESGRVMGRIYER